MIAFRLREYAEAPSTNELVKRAIEEGEPEGLAVRADVQTAGYGRQGRRWESPAGGLYLSLLLRPQVEPRVLPTISLATAVAVRRALAGFLTPPSADAIQLKWPNDLVVSESLVERHGASDPATRAEAVPATARRAGTAAYGKLAGLSHELHAGALCVGIGVNVAAPPVAPAPVGGKNAPVYLRDLPGAEGASPADVAHAVLREYAGVYESWLRGGIEGLLGEYNAHACLAGRTVRIATADGTPTCEGVARGVDGDGRLVVEDAHGARRAVASGEAHLL